MPYARNQWAIMKEFSALPSRDGTYRTLTRYQQLFILEEKKLDIEEIKRAEKGVDPDDAKQFYDNETSWWDDPEHNGLFDDDPQSEDELASALDKFIDDETRAKIDSKMDALHDNDGAEHEASIQEELERRKNLVAKLVEDPNKLKEYRKSIRDKKDYTPEEIDSEDSPSELVDTRTDEQKRLARLALDNTMKALHGDKA